MRKERPLRDIRTHPRPLMTETEYAAFVGKSIHAVRRDRATGAGPRYIRIGGAVRYVPADVEEFLDRNANRELHKKRRSTREPAAVAS